MSPEIQSGNLAGESGYQESIFPPQEVADKWEGGVPSFEILKSSLAAAGYHVTAPRKFLSSGIKGPLYLIETDRGPVVEKTFIYGGVSKRHEASFGQSMARVGLDSVRSNPVRPKYSVLFESGGTDKGSRDVVIDWVSNEETALTDLAGIPGIPRFIATAVDGSKQSVIEEFIDGFDLAELPSQAIGNEEIRAIISKILATYVAAAKRDYIYNNLAGSTILVDRKTRQPYLLDWYNHVPGVLIEDKEAVLRQGEERLRDLERYFLGN